MIKQGIICVLIVDDSALVRDMIRAVLESDPGIKVVGEASDGMEAISKVASLKPDIVTMDIEMPVMGGLEAIEKIIAQNPVPILVVTALTGVRTAFTAVSKGALDVIEKPDISLENVRNLISKIHRLARVDVAAHQASLKKTAVPPSVSNATVPKTSTKGGIVAIASSTGGPQAINSILSHLPSKFPVPIVITQHIAEGFTQGMVDWLNTVTQLKVHVAANGEKLLAGHVYINPAEHSMRITELGIIVLGDREHNQVYKPSCDTLLTSVASSYRKTAIGLILSGMGDDGVAGMHSIKIAGGMTLAQDAKSSVVYGMNRIAVERGYIHRIIQLADIPSELMHRVGVRQ